MMNIIYQNLNLTTILISTSLIVLLLFFNNNFIKPYIKLIRKRNQLIGKYDYYQYPFLPFGLSFVKQFLDGLKNHGDSLYNQRYIFSKKDITIGTLRDHVFITFGNQQLIQQFIQKQNQGYYFKTNDRVHYNSMKQIFGNGLLLSQNEQWKNKRKILSQLFNYQFIKSKFNIIKSIVQQIINKYINQYKNNKIIQFQIGLMFQEIFGTIVLKCFFGQIYLQSINNKTFYKFLNQLLNKISDRNLRISSFLFGSILNKYSIRKIDKQIKQQIIIFRQYTKTIINKIIQDIKNNKKYQQEGLICKLIKQNKFIYTHNQTQYHQGKYTLQDLINQLSTFFFAGTDTTSNSISNIIFKLIQRKDIQQKLRIQIKNIINNDINNLTLQNLKQMKYVRYCQSQILRVFAPAPVLMLRQAKYTHKIGGIIIQKGDYVDIQILGIHHKQSIYNNPHQFIPQRWQQLQNTTKIRKNYLPFSLGARSCMGQQLSLLQGKIALIMFLLKFKTFISQSSPIYKFFIVYGLENTVMKLQLSS